MEPSDSSPAEPTFTMSVDDALAAARKLVAAGRLPPAESIYRRILAVAPAHPMALYMLGGIELQTGRRRDAEQRFRRVLALRPHNADTHAALAMALCELGELSEAELLARRAIELNPKLHLGYAVLGRTLQTWGRHAEALTAFERAVSLQPNDPALMTSLLFTMTQDEATDPDRLASAHRQFGRRFGSNLPDRVREHANLRAPDRCLRIGFVSGDLRQHAVTYFIEPIWREIDRGQFELFAYSSHPAEDATSERLKGLVDAWRPVASLDDAQLARRIVADGIDILIDLSGHTVGNRLLAFARKPAPVQATWIGYPETTGLTAMDYYIADPYSAPPGAIDDYYVEKLVRLPGGSGFRPDPDSPEVNPLPALERGYVTFGSFNRLSKFGASVVETWARVLRAVPGSRMLIANVDEAAMAADLGERFAAFGIASERLRLVQRQPLAEYLQMHREVDVLLDTFPYTGGTTTQHALWMGVPVITIAGRRRSERVSTANLLRIGLDDWSVASKDDYVARAVRAAGELDELAALRAGLRDRIRSSPLRQAPVNARSLEVALRAMWHRWCAGEPPQAISVSLEQALAGAAS